MRQQEEWIGIQSYIGLYNYIKLYRIGFKVMFNRKDEQLQVYSWMAGLRCLGRITCKGWLAGASVSFPYFLLPVSEVTILGQAGRHGYVHFHLEMPSGMGVPDSDRPSCPLSCCPQLATS